jgi:hypothetical protein
MTTRYYTNIEDDYRSGRKLKVIPENIATDEETEEFMQINIDTPSSGYRIYIMIDFPLYKPVLHIDSVKYNCWWVDKIYSQINGCMPFQATGHNEAYKELGHYPEIPENIKLMPDIIPESLVYDIKNTDDSIFYVLIIDSEGPIMDAQLLNY